MSEILLSHMLKSCKLTYLVGLVIISLWGCDRTVNQPNGAEDNINDSVNEASTEEIKQDSSTAFVVQTIFHKSEVNNGDTILERLYLPESGKGKWMKYMNGKFCGGIKGSWSNMPESWSVGNERIIEIFRDTCFIELSEEPINCIYVFPSAHISVVLSNPRSYFCVDSSFDQSSNISSACSKGLFH
jgi:hypothetical protein